MTCTSCDWQACRHLVQLTELLHMICVLVTGLVGGDVLMLDW